MDAWRGLRRLRSPDAFGAWFRTIVIRKARRSARRSPASISLDSVGSAAGHDLDSDGLDRRLAVSQLMRALNRLDADDRVVLVLQFHLGLPQGEIAGMLKVPTGTVKSRVHRAISRLRAAYGAEERA